MTWADFYLICFFLGFVLSVLSLLGSLHLHLPHFDIHIGGDHAHAPHSGGGHTGEVAPINFGTVAAFLAWFGGTGYLLARFSTFWFLFGFVIACASGLVGAAIVFFFLAKVLIRHDEELEPGGLRYDRHAGHPQQQHSSVRHRRDDLFAGGYAVAPLPRAVMTESRSPKEPKSL